MNSWRCLNWHSSLLILVHRCRLNFEDRRTSPSACKSLIPAIRLFLPIVVLLDDLIDGVLVDILRHSRVLEVLDLEWAILRLSVDRIEVGLSCSLVDSDKLSSGRVGSPKVSLTRLHWNRRAQ